MEIKVTDYHHNSGIYNFTIQHKQINGITGSNSQDIYDILKIPHTYKGKILIDNKELLKEEINNIKRKIAFINKHINKELCLYKVYECMYQEIRRKKLTLRDPKKKIMDALKIMGLDISYLNRNIKELSTSEKKLIQFSLALLSNPDVIIIEEFLNQLDWKAEKRMMLLLEKLIEDYNKTIVLISNNSDILYQYCNHIIITKNQEVLVEGNAKETLQRVDFLKRNGIKIPEKVEWTYLAKKEKNAKIDYHKDVRDMIKDIYKHI